MAHIIILNSTLRQRADMPKGADTEELSGLACLLLGQPLNRKRLYNRRKDGIQSLFLRKTTIHGRNNGGIQADCGRC